MMPLMQYQFLRWVGIRGLRGGSSRSLVFGVVQVVVVVVFGQAGAEGVDGEDGEDGVEGVDSMDRVNRVDRVDRMPAELSEDEDVGAGVGNVDGALALAARAYSRLSATTRRTERRTPYERAASALPALRSRFFTPLPLLVSVGGATTMRPSWSAILEGL